jgi:uncharacterized membrane protein
MAKTSEKVFWKDFRRFFIRGLATLLPTVLTIVVLVKCFEFIQENISVHITKGLVWAVVQATDDYPKISEEDYPPLDEEQRRKYYKRLEKEGLLPRTSLDNEDLVAIAINDLYMGDEIVRQELRIEKMRSRWLHGPYSLVGFGIAIVFVYILGRLLASFFGRRLLLLFESVMARVPGFKQIYPHIKQVTEFLFGEQKIEFSRVVAVPYPRKGIWSLGLVTGSGIRRISESEKSEDDAYITVFIPSSPTPVTGYVITVSNAEAIDLPLSIEEALRFTVSGGVIVPGHQSQPAGKIELGLSSDLKSEEPSE